MTVESKSKVMPLMASDFGVLKPIRTTPNGQHELGDELFGSIAAIGAGLRVRLRIQPQVGEDLLDDLPLEDGRDDLEFLAAAVRIVLHVDVEHAPEQPRPADAVRLR
ncbi:MAG: hypothetical protein ACKO15_09005 [Burkholderiales bacterium]